MNMAEALLHAFKDHGAKEIFGIPGDFALPFFKVVEESGILPLYTLSHEPAVGFAADASARYRTDISVATVTYGAGALNMTNAIASAYAEKAPVVVLSGAPGLTEGRSGLLLHHQVKSLDSQYLIYKEITCDQAKLDDPRTAPELIARVLRNCKKHSQPVYLELPRDLVFESCEPVPVIESPKEDPEAIAACADEIMARLEQAKNPALIVGVEVRRYGLEKQVEELTTRLGLPVVTSFMGRGLLAQSCTPVLGTYMGMAGDESLTELIEGSDCLLMMGVLMSDTNFGVSSNQLNMRTAIQMNESEVTLGYHSYKGITLKGIITELLNRVMDKPFDCKPPQTDYPYGLEADSAPITPTDIAKAVNDFFKEKGIMPMASDVGDCLFTALDIENNAMVAPGYYATMGYGVPAGLGVQVATGERPLILVGDGAFQMTGLELGNCRKNGWNPIVLLFNNESWELLRTFQPESNFNSLQGWSYASMTEGMGGIGHRVTTRKELKEALDNAHADTDHFHLIEIMIPEGEVSETLARFVSGFKARRAKQGG